MRELLIVGVDPGTTLGYAVLDTNGRLLRTRSSKQLELNSMLEEVVRLGSILVIGTDKKKCPGLIEKAAAATGAKIVTPRDDLTTVEKEAITRGERTSNNHEKDALAAAIYAHREIGPLLERIRKALEKEGKRQFFRQVAETVLATGTNIKDALREAESEAAMEQEKPVVVAIAAELASQDSEAVAARRFLETRLKRAEKENEILRGYSRKLLQKLRQAADDARKAAKKEAAEKKSTAGLATDEREIHMKELVRKMQAVTDSKNAAMVRMLAETEKLERIVAAGGIVAKKLNTLGFEELQHKNQTLRIAENDIVLVENAEIYSEKALEYLARRNVLLLLRKKASAKVWNVFRQAGVMAADAGNTVLSEAGNFAAIDAAGLAEAKEQLAKSDITGLIENYKEERKMQLL